MEYGKYKTGKAPCILCKCRWVTSGFGGINPTRVEIFRHSIAILCKLLAELTGPDEEIDALILKTWNVGPASPTGSVEGAKHVAGLVAPGASLHIGYGVTGIFPEARLDDGDSTVFVEAPTVPIAILRAAFLFAARKVP